MTAARELRAEETVDRDPLKIPDTNSPERPGTEPIVSTTYRGSNWGEKKKGYHVTLSLNLTKKKKKNTEVQYVLWYQQNQSDKKHFYSKRKTNATPDLNS